MELCKLKPRNLHQTGKNFVQLNLRWNDLLETPEFNGFTKEYNIGAYEIEFIRQGFFAEDLHAVQKSNIIPFGTFKGKTIEDTDDKYLKWILRQDWLDRWPGLEESIKEYFKIKEIDNASPEEIKDILKKID